MKTNRIQNGSYENADEMLGNAHRLPITRALTSRKAASTACTTEVRPTTRKRLTVKKETVTEIAVKVDIGFGNTLFIRGEGEGLNWDKGQPLICVDGSLWTWSRCPGKEPVTFKLLVNDQLWSRGENFQVQAGHQIEVVPDF